MSRWRKYNPNPAGRNNVGDCSVRAVSSALGISWEEAFWLIAEAGFELGDVISSNSVWGSVLRQHGFRRYAISNKCPNCYTIGDFARDHSNGIYVVGTGNHVVTVKDGEIWDSWDSSNEIPQYYWALVST